VRLDRRYWDRLTAPLVGKWLDDKTSVTKVCEFAQRVFADKDLKNFKGDPAFASKPAMQKALSKLRSSIGGVYAWRALNSQSAVEKQRMQKAADYAFRQAFVLCPYSPEAVFRYVNLLLPDQRFDDALAIAHTAASVSKSVGESLQQIEDLIAKLKELKAQKTPAAVKP